MDISLTKLWVLELADFADKVIRASNSGRYTFVGTHPIFTELQAKNAAYQQVYSKLTYSGQGKAVAEADKKRDTAFLTLRDFLNSYRKMTTMPRVAEAESLYRVFKQYGTGLHNLSYASESAQLKKLIAGLGTAAHADALAALNLTDAFTNLKEAHADFETLYGQQAEANADLRALPSATGVRVGLEKALRKYLDLLTLMNDVPEWEMLYKEISVLATAAKNSHRDSAGKGDGPTPPTS